MNSIEEQEITKLPEKYKPLGAWAYFGYSILFSLPIIGLIFLIVFACSSSNINRRSFARSYFCVYVLIAVVILIAVFAFGLNFAVLFGNLSKV